jgi:hypothetical protein
MARPLQIQIVERARVLIADGQHWSRGDLARDINGEEVSPTAASAVKRWSGRSDRGGSRTHA